MWAFKAVWSFYVGVDNTIVWKQCMHFRTRQKVQSSRLAYSMHWFTINHNKYRLIVYNRLPPESKAVNRVHHRRNHQIARRRSCCCFWSIESRLSIIFDLKKLTNLSRHNIISTLCAQTWCRWNLFSGYTMELTLTEKAENDCLLRGQQYA